MTKTFCDPLKGVDKVSYDLCVMLKARDASLSGSAIDLGVTYVDFTDKSRPQKSTKPDGKISPQEMRQYALKVVTKEYLGRVEPGVE